MRLDRDEFDITFDASQADEAQLIAVIRQSGYTASLAQNASAASPVSPPTTLAEAPPILKDALARAQREHKPVVLDFRAEWCLPCQRMLRESFADPRVTALLERCVLVKIDTDRYPELARRFGVSGLPDIRFLGSDGYEKKKLVDYQGPEALAKALEELLDGSPTNRQK
jgi:thiol:disulfide interchange protein DsbD